MLNNKNAIVTGGDKGIGKAIVLKFAEQGANVSFTYNSDLESARAVQEEALKYNTKIAYYQMNLAEPEQIKNTVKDIISEMKTIDILVNNAGSVDDFLFAKADIERWFNIMQINFNGAVRVTKIVLEKMIRELNGTIINVASTAGLIGIPGQSNYSASKAALISLTKTLGKELARLGIRVNAIAPGYTDTEMLKKYSVEISEQFKKSIPMHRFGKTAEVANTALFLASEMSSYITSQVIVVDGGMC
jgi:3-oxoacyl-[acyl-carrier protein] reductase